MLLQSILLLASLFPIGIFADLKTNDKFESVLRFDVLVPDDEDQDIKSVDDWTSNFIDGLWNSVKNLSKGNYVRACPVIQFDSTLEPASFMLLDRTDSEKKEQKEKIKQALQTKKSIGTPTRHELLDHYCKQAIANGAPEIAVYVRKEPNKTDWLHYVVQELIPAKLETAEEKFGFYVVTNQFAQSTSENRMVMCQFNENERNFWNWTDNALGFGKQFEKAAQQIKLSLQEWLRRCNYTDVPKGCYHRPPGGELKYALVCTIRKDRTPTLPADSADKKFCLTGSYYRTDCDNKICAANCAKHEHWSVCNVTTCELKGYRYKFMKVPDDEGYLWHCPAHLHPPVETCRPEYCVDVNLGVIIMAVGGVLLLLIAGAGFAFYWFVFRETPRDRREKNRDEARYARGKIPTTTPTGNAAKKSETGFPPSTQSLEKGGAGEAVKSSKTVAPFKK